MPASVTFACKHCAKFKECEDKPEDGYKNLKMGAVHCFRHKSIQSDAEKKAIKENKKKAKNEL